MPREKKGSGKQGIVSGVITRGPSLPLAGPHSVIVWTSGGEGTTSFIHSHPRSQPLLMIIITPAPDIDKEMYLLFHLPLSLHLS